MKRKKRVRRHLVHAAIFVFAFLFFHGLVQNARVNQAVNAFVSRGDEGEIFEVTFPDGTVEKRMVHGIAREAYFETEDSRSVFYSSPSNPYLGNKGDIFVTQESPFPNWFGLHQLVTFFVGGHAALNNGRNQFIEAIGFPSPGENIIDIIKTPSDGSHDYSVGVRQSNSNYWMKPNFRSADDPLYPYYGAYYRDTFIVLRVKSADDAQLERTLQYATNHLENKSLYNFLFLTDTENKFYCTDLISRAYQYGLDPDKADDNYPKALNDNGFVTTVNDLLLSKDTYIAAVVMNKEGVRHIYYLEDVE